MSHLRKILEKVAEACLQKDGDILSLILPEECLRSETCECGGSLIQRYDEKTDQPQDFMRVKFGVKYNRWKEGTVCACSACARIYGHKSMGNQELNKYHELIAGHRLVLMRTSQEFDLKRMFMADTIKLMFPSLVIPKGQVIAIFETNHSNQNTPGLLVGKMLEHKEYLKWDQAFDDVEVKAAPRMVDGKVVFGKRTVQVPREDAWDECPTCFASILEGFSENGIVGTFLPTRFIPAAYFEMQERDTFEWKNLMDVLVGMHQKSKGAFLSFSDINFSDN